MLSVRLLLATLLGISPVLAAAESDYPTLDRVNYALDCMDRHGGQTIDNLVACSCEIDMVAAKLSYEEFIDANIYLQNKDMAGDKGGVIRDSKFAQNSYQDLLSLRKDAEQRCFVRERVVQRKSQTKVPDSAGAAEGEASAAEAPAEAPKSEIRQ